MDKNEYAPPKTPVEKYVPFRGITFVQVVVSLFLSAIASVIAFVSTCFPAIYVLDKVSGASSSHPGFKNAIDGLSIAFTVGVFVFIVMAVILIRREIGRQKQKRKDPPSDP